MCSSDKDLLSVISAIQSCTIVVIRFPQLWYVLKSFRIPNSISVFDPDWLQLKQSINYCIIDS